MSIFARKGGYLGLVASSRVRLARNLMGYRFGQQTPDTLREIADKVFAALEAAPALQGVFSRIEVAAQSAEALRLVEQHVISPDLAAAGGWAIVSADGAVSILIGEEDHIRLQVMGRGLCPKECLDEAQRLAALLESALPVAKDDKLGYLTACPTNVGTGLRVSVMLHLPVLTEAGGIPRVMNWAGRQGCALRGAFGEGTEPVGGFYQLSNQVTLGISEQALTERLVSLAMQLLEAEQKARQALRERDEIGLADRVCRAAGTLLGARRMETREAERLLSDVLLGLSMELLSGVTPEAVYALEGDIRPASLMHAAGTELTPATRDEHRATLLRTQIGKHIRLEPPNV